MYVPRCVTGGRSRSSYRLYLDSASSSIDYSCSCQLTTVSCLLADAVHPSSLREQSFLLSTLRRLIKRFRNYKTSALCSRSSCTIALYPSSAVQYSTINRLVRLRQPRRHFSPPADPPPPSLSLPAPTGGTWPPPPRASLGHGRESCLVPQAVKTCPDVATNYGGRFPFIALMSRHIERSYIHHPRPSSHAQIIQLQIPAPRSRSPWPFPIWRSSSSPSYRRRVPRPCVQFICRQLNHSR